jgi:aconitate hydratase
VVTDYLTKTGLQSELDQLGFQTVGYGCTTCIGNSGPLDAGIEDVVKANDIVAPPCSPVTATSKPASTRASRPTSSCPHRWSSPTPSPAPWTLTSAQNELGITADGKDVFLKDIWPTLQEVRDAMQSALSPEVFRKLYTDFASQNPKWNEIQGSVGEVFEWDGASTYIQHATLLRWLQHDPGDITEIQGARPLGIFGDSVTTDHISPAGAIKTRQPRWPLPAEHGVTKADFNSYGSRRGNDLIMTRGTFANVRIKNLMLGGEEGGNTLLQPAGEKVSIYDAARGLPSRRHAHHRHRRRGLRHGLQPRLGRQRHRLLGVKAVITKSFERIHRSNLVGMGVLPCNFKNKADYDKVKDLSDATFDILGLSNEFKPQGEATLRVTQADGNSFELPLVVRIDTPVEVDYYRAGGILPYVLAQILRANA